MTSHDWYLLSFLFFFRTCCTKSKHWSTSWHQSMKRFCLWYTFRSLLQIQAAAAAFNIFIFCLISALCAVTSWGHAKCQQIVWSASQGARWVQLSISHFPLFISIFCLASICSNIDLSINDCPPLVRVLVTCGGRAACSTKRQRPPQWDNYAENGHGQIVVALNLTDMILLMFGVDCILFTIKKKSRSVISDTLCSH